MYKSMFYTLEELVPIDVTINDENESWLRLDTGCLIDLDIVTSFWESKIILNKNINKFTGSIEGRSFTLAPKNKKYIQLYKLIETLIAEGTLKHINTLQHYSSTKGFIFMAQLNTQERPLIK